MNAKGLPHFAAGVVIKGFGRGSKDLGIATANFGPEVVDNLPADVGTGVYFGWASLAGGPVHKMVMSVGWNPFFNNTRKSMETHIMHKFDGPFYGETLRVCMAGYLRPERDFASLQELVDAIRDDIERAEHSLDLPEFSRYKQHPFFGHGDGDAHLNGS